MFSKQSFANAVTTTIIVGGTLTASPSPAENFIHGTCPGVGSSKAETRVIHCPAGISLGSLSVQANVDGSPKVHSVPARGEVKLNVPAHAIVLLDVSSAVQVHPEALLKLKDEPIDVLYMRHFRSLDDSASSSDPILNSVKSLSKLRYFMAYDTDTTDEGLSNLKELKELRAIKLFLTTTTGRFLNDIHGAPNLYWLRLWLANIDPKYLSNLSSFPELRWLMVRACHLNEAGVKYIARCSKLEELGLDENAIDDKMLAHLSALKNLQRLSLSNTSISLHGLEALKGLPLKVLVLPTQIGAEKDKALAKLFPTAVFMHPVRRKATADENVIFAPTQR